MPALHNYAALPVFLILLLAGCASLPDHTQRQESQAIAKAGTSTLAQTIRTARENHPGKSGFQLLKSGVDALLARLTLAEKAEFSLDVQYYIWHPDLAGAVFAQAMLRAADRGVRVRILLDDIGARANDQTLLALDSHPNIEIRLFNPVASRSFRNLGMLFDFPRINRRMHNKAFIADNQVAIVGGRNIGDEYFDAPGEVVFGDLDVLTVGKVVPEVSLSFDRFWNTPHSLPISILVTDKPDDMGIAPLARLQTDLSAYLKRQRNNPYIRQAQAQFELGLAQGDMPLVWGDAQLLYDAPDKIVQDPGQATGNLLNQFSAVGPKIKEELLIVSPYFIPGKAGLAWLQGLTARGVKVTVLTNSLAATDVAAVHAGYQQYRRDLLQAGVQLYELKPDISHHPHAPKSMLNKLLENSRASLHAKVFALDRSAIFIGSLNLDPRSVRLNTEIGVLCSSKELSEDVVSGLENSIGDIAWKVEQRKDRNDNARLVWIEQGSSGTLEIDEEPNVGSWRKLSVWLLQWLPIESQL